jgi:NADPH:quinone reductase-like Zn-dependent oxidoreductase
MAWTVPAGTAFGSLKTLQFREVVPQSSGRVDSIYNQTNVDNNITASYCRVSTRAVGLNFADIFCALGLYQAANQVRGGKDGDFIPGLEFAGVVVDDPTNTYNMGQPVLGFCRFGAYTDIVHVPIDYLYPLPTPSWSYIEGASFLVQALTAWHGLVTVGGMPNLTYKEDRNDNDSTDSKRRARQRLRRQHYIVLVHSAAGGVGLWASEIAARRGALVIGVVGESRGSDDDGRSNSDFGIGNVSNAKEETFLKRILPLSPLSRTISRGNERTFAKRLKLLLCDIHDDSMACGDCEPSDDDNDDNLGIDLCMESLGGMYLTASYDMLRKGGSLVTYGSTSYVTPGLGINRLRLIWRYLTRPMIDPGTLTSRNTRLAGFNLIYLTDRPRDLRRELTDCIRCLSGEQSESDDCTGSIASLEHVTPPVVGKVFNFRSETIEAMEYLKSGRSVGKVVLDNSQNTAM